MVDMVVKYIYEKHKNQRKSLLWDVFGEDIINNIKTNLRYSLENGYIMCKNCGKRIKQNTNNQIYCDKCAKRIKQNKINLLKKQKRRNNSEM